MDERKRTGIDILDAHTHGIAVYYKTTRAGCTTAVISEFIDRHEGFVVLEPTNNIAATTVIEEAKKYSRVGEANIIQALSNRFCIHNQERIDANPDLEFLPVLPLPEKCTDCEYYEECEVTKIRREDADGYVLTYHKLVALILGAQMSDESAAASVLKRLSYKPNFLFDEIHEAMMPKLTTVMVYSASTGRADLTKYMQLSYDYKLLWDAARRFTKLLTNEATDVLIHSLLGGAEDAEWYDKHLSAKIPNIMYETDSMAYMIAAYSQIIKLMENRHDYGFSVDDVLRLYDMIVILSEGVISVSALKTDEDTTVQFTGVDRMFNHLIKRFMIEAHESQPEGRVILTSATITNMTHDLIMYGVTDNYLFGAGGDPMNTNDKMLIIADSKKAPLFGSYMTKYVKDVVAGEIANMLDIVGDDAALVITINKRVAGILTSALKQLKHSPQVTYYRSPDVMGVKCDKRIVFAVGAAYKPANTYDPMTTTSEESKSVGASNMHGDTWQAWSRGKDPNGKEPSLVIVFGVNADECTAISTWGADRSVSVTKDEYKNVVSVACDGKYVSTPTVYLRQDFPDLLKLADVHMEGKYDFTGIKEGGETVERFPIQVTWRDIDDVYEYLNLFVGNTEEFAYKQIDRRVKNNITSKWLKHLSPFGRNWLENHYEGREVIGSYTMMTGEHAGMVRYICFDIDAHRSADDTDITYAEKALAAEDDMDRLDNYLQLHGIPFVAEASGSLHSYHIWLLLEPVEIGKAFYFGREILRRAGVDCEMFPKQSNKKGKYGNQVKLPYAKHTTRRFGFEAIGKIRDETGKWQSDFEPQRVGVMDISSLKSHRVGGVSKKRNGVIIRLAGIRPCIENMLTQQLTGEQGHFCRIAVCREYVNSGMPAENVAMLFENQPDFDYETSLGYVTGLMETPTAHVRRPKLLENASRYVTEKMCSECPRDDCKRRN